MRTQTTGRVAMLAVPAVWKKAAGLWRGKKIKDPVAYQKRLRKQWEKRLEKLA